MSKKLVRDAIARSKISSDLSILSWNINDSRSANEGLKTEDKAFTSLLTSHDIFCLQETKDCINVPNYICYNSNRPDSRSGGVCIGVKKSLANGVTQIKINESHDIIGVTLRAKFFNLSQDIAILNVYNSPDNSSYSIRKKFEDSEHVSTMDALAEMILNIPANRSIFLAGDLNARTGNLEDMHPQSFHPGCDDAIWDTEYPINLPQRSNKDQNTNTNGRTFTELAKSAGLVILNGRTIGDIFGDYTCYKYNGSSTVDYMCTSSYLYESVKFLKVLEFTIFSDHRPLSAAICANITPVAKELHISRYIDAPKPFNWVKGNTDYKEGSTKKL